MFSIRSDDGLCLEPKPFESPYGDLLKLSTPLIRLNFHFLCRFIEYHSIYSARMIYIGYLSFCIIYSFGVEKTNTFTSSHDILENHKRFMPTMGRPKRLNFAYIGSTLPSPLGKLRAVALNRSKCHCTSFAVIVVQKEGELEKRRAKVNLDRTLSKLYKAFRFPISGVDKSMLENTKG